MTKKAKKRQQYDEYWKLTVEYSDMHGDLFSKVLNLILDFIDDNDLAANECTEEQNKELQKNINQINPKKDMGSVRKSINQFIKLGFVKPGYRGYHNLAKKFLKATDKKERELLFTQIFYEAGSLGSSYSKDRTDTKEINFLLRTLAYKGELTREEIIGLMVTDVSKFPRGYMLPEELERQSKYARLRKFDENKYNQIEYLIGFLKYMPELSYEKGKLQFTDGKSVVAGNDVISLKRDPVLMRIYKRKLADESEIVYKQVICYACKQPWKGLVASHIKPLSTCLAEQSSTEAYDKNNGLLLSPNIDAYFDKFDISFNDEGKIMIGKAVPPEIRDIMKEYQLDKSIMTTERMKFMKFHRTEFLEKQK